MKAVVIDLSGDEMKAFQTALSHLKDVETKEPLTANQLLTELARDIALTSSHGAGWESDNMQAVIDGHGWENHFDDE